MRCGTKEGRKTTNNRKAARCGGQLRTRLGEEQWARRRRVRMVQRVRVSLPVLTRQQAETPEGERGAKKIGVGVGVCERVRWELISHEGDRWRSGMDGQRRRGEEEKSSGGRRALQRRWEGREGREDGANKRKERRSRSAVDRHGGAVRKLEQRRGKRTE